MFVSVDKQDPQAQIEGFSYTSSTGFEEKVVLRQSWVDIVVSGGSDSVGIYYEDIPKLVKALQAVQKHKEQHEQHN